MLDAKLYRAGQAPARSPLEGVMELCGYSRRVPHPSGGMTRRLGLTSAPDFGKLEPAMLCCNRPKGHDGDCGPPLPGDRHTHVVTP